MDEKSWIQALDRSQPVLPIMPRCLSARSHDYVLAGTTLDTEVSAGLEARLIPNNYVTHKVPRGQAMAGGASALSPALHADRMVLAQPGGAVVRRTRPEKAPPWVHCAVQAFERDIRAWLADCQEITDDTGGTSALVSGVLVRAEVLDQTELRESVEEAALDAAQIADGRSRARPLMRASTISLLLS
ncbi:hypothetical protein [Streptomyces sp. NPDC097610]|uniref:hypothetical protein n=1 Tax=Streptomyces sp. NPDC097610 TaxID=3157227 RepID=UPI0033192844